MKRRDSRAPGVQDALRMTRRRLAGYKPSRRPKNVAEGLCYDALTTAGWRVSKRGWPDFCAFKHGTMIVVEVKSSHTHGLRQEQHDIMQFLASKGILCYRWTPETSFAQLHAKLPK